MPYYDNDNNDANSLNTNDRILEAKRQLQRSDKYFQRVTRTVLDKEKTKKRDDGKEYYKTVYVNLYGSGSLGTKIRNAVTGERYEYKVGSRDQDMFYSVALCTGENGMKESLALFYDSPEQYENHMFQNLDITVKNNWHYDCIKFKKEIGLIV
jgi:hypothetical protein